MSVQTRLDVTVRKAKIAGDTKGINSAIFSAVSAATPGKVTDNTTYDVDDQDDKTILLKIDGGDEQTILFDITVTTNLLAAQQINDKLVGGSAGVVGGQVVISSDSVGVDSSVEITGGTSDLTWTAPVVGTGGVGVPQNTVVAKNPATNKYVALTDITATDGTEMPRGIFVGSDISAADLEAGDVTGQMVIIGGDGVVWDKDLLLFQGGISLTDEITNQNLTVEDALVNIGIFAQDVEYVSQHENA